MCVTRVGMSRAAMYLLESSQYECLMSAAMMLWSME